MKAVAIVMAGRRKYLECLIPYLLRDLHLFDHIQLWDNAADEDSAYLRELAETWPGVFEVKTLPEGERIIPKDDAAHRVANLAKFYRYATDVDTIYIKFDDDIVWIEEGAIERLLAYREMHPKWWMVIGNVLNNSATYLLHRNETPEWEDEYTNGIYKSAEVANTIHEEFLTRGRLGDLSEYRFNIWAGGNTKQIPNQVYAFLGRDWAEFGGKVQSHDEYLWLARTKREEMSRSSCVYGPSLFVHYSYFPQQDGIDHSHLEAYTKLAKEVA